MHKSVKKGLPSTGAWVEVRKYHKLSDHEQIALCCLKDTELNYS